MRPVSYKPKTGRRFRGLEVAQAALLLVLGVAVAMALYFVMMDILQATPVPDVELDPYNSYINNRFGLVTLKFGRTTTIHRMWIDDSYGYGIATCTPYPEGVFPVTVYKGQSKSFVCVLNESKQWDRTYMRVLLTVDNNQFVSVEWVVK